MSADKVQKVLKQLQNAALVAYLKKLVELQRKGCPIDPRILITPFELKGFLLSRDLEGGARLRKNTWTYYLVRKPHVLELSFDASGIERIQPKIEVTSAEKGAKFSSLFFSPF